MAGWVEYNGVSSAAFGLKVESIPSEIGAKRRVREVEIPGRSGLLHVDEEAYDSIDIPVVFNMNGSTDRRSIMAWLDGWGKIVFSDNPTFCRRGFVPEGPQFKYRRLPGGIVYDSFTAKFQCDPFWYQTIPAGHEFTVSGGHITNLGTVKAEPIIEVLGQGEIVLTIGDISLTLTDVSNPLKAVVIDSTARFAYTTDPNDVLQLTLNDEEWPILNLGDTTISWTGTVSKVTIVPNWRWL